MRTDEEMRDRFRQSAARMEERWKNVNPTADEADKARWLASVESAEEITSDDRQPAWGQSILTRGLNAFVALAYSALALLTVYYLAVILHGGR